MPAVVHASFPKKGTKTPSRVCVLRSERMPSVPPSRNTRRDWRAALCLSIARLPNLVLMRSIISSMRGLSSGRTRKLSGYSSADQPKLCNSQTAQVARQENHAAFIFSASRRWASPTSSYSISLAQLLGRRFWQLTKFTEQATETGKDPRSSRLRSLLRHFGESNFQIALARAAQLPGQEISKSSQSPTRWRSPASAAVFPG